MCTPKIQIPLMVAACVVVVVILFGFNPENALWAPKCPFLLLTGWECPGCGSQRAIHHLLHLRLATALQFNPILVLAIPYLGLLFYLQYAGGARHFPKLHNRITSRTAIYIILGIILVYSVGRNIVPRLSVKPKTQVEKCLTPPKIHTSKKVCNGEI